MTLRAAGEGHTATATALLTSCGCRWCDDRTRAAAAGIVPEYSLRRLISTHQSEVRTLLGVQLQQRIGVGSEGGEAMLQRQTEIEVRQMAEGRTSETKTEKRQTNKQ